MQIQRDDEIFAALSAEFVIRYIDLAARLLHQAPAVEFDIFNLTQEAEELLFDLCFFGIASFEEKSGIKHGSVSYLPLALFREKQGTEGDWVIGNTSLHGLVDDPLLSAGLDRARSILEPA